MIVSGTVTTWGVSPWSARVAGLLMGGEMSEDAGRDRVDPIDEEAANIDVRDESAAEEIEELVEHARDLGRDADAEVDPDAPGS